MFDQAPDYLRLGKTELPHSSASSGLGRLYIIERDFAGGQVSRISAMQRISRLRTFERVETGKIQTALSLRS